MINPSKTDLELLRELLDKVESHKESVAFSEEEVEALKRWANFITGWDASGRFFGVFKTIITNIGWLVLTAAALKLYVIDWLREVLITR